MDDREQLLYAIDFTCRAMKDPAQAVRLIHRLCVQAQVPYAAGPAAVDGGP